MKALRHFRKHVSQNIPQPGSCNLLTMQPGYVVITAIPGSAIEYDKTTLMFLHCI